MRTWTTVSKMLAAIALLSLLIQQSACEASVEKKELSPEEVRSESADLSVASADDRTPAVVETIVAPGGRALSLEEDDTDSTDIESESRQHQHGIKIKKKKKKPKLKKSKKLLKKILPFLLIPLLIQAKLIPLFIFKLKLLALKAFGIGKLALLLIIGNVIYNAMHGAQNVDQQYSKEVLANEHYGYTGGPEFGAWVNRRHVELSS